MCGIVGVLTSHQVDPHVVETMRDRLSHRGPDHAGLWQSADGRTCLGHRRLSIIDLAPEANQPFASSDGRFQVTFNGEIYNYRALRAELELEGVHFRTMSDTEVLVEAWRRWQEACLPRLSGMFAFALWDAQQRTLFCARDRAGEKPFHYAETGGDFIFGSELKALVEWPSFQRRIYAPALIDFLSFGFITEPATIWESCFKLPAGHWMAVRLPLAGPPKVSTPVEYWDFRFNPDYTVRDWSEPIRSAIQFASDEMAVADVPLGTFLSGGVDSSAVTAALSRAGHAVQSFTIGFDERGYDERPWARQVAKQYRTEHHERVVSADDIDAVLETLLWQYDEPFGDYSYLPTYYLCREARRSITVALSGDGGDEVFGGYRRYQRLGARTAIERVVPKSLLAAAAGAGAWLVRGKGRHRTLRQYAAPPLIALTDMLTLGMTVPELRADARGPLAGALDQYRPEDTVARLLRQAPPRDVGLVNAMRYLDIKLTLAGGILVKVDRASMAVALEVRPVFLQRDVMALAGRIPSSALVTPRHAKRALKTAFEPWLPTAVLHRRKMGFALPLAQWLRRSAGASPLAGAARNRINEFVDPRLMQRLEAEHSVGSANHTATIHNLAFLDRWLARWT